MDTEQIDYMLKRMAETERKSTNIITDNLDKKINNTFYNLDKMKMVKNKAMKVAVSVLLCITVLIAINPQKTLAAVKTLFSYMGYGQKNVTVDKKYVKSIDKTITANDVNVNVTEAAVDGNNIIVCYKINSAKFDFNNGFKVSNANTELNIKIDGKEQESVYEGLTIEKVDKNSITIKQVLQFASLPNNLYVNFDFKKILGIPGEWNYNFQLSTIK